MAEWQKLSLHAEALAALGAELRLRCDGLEGDPQVRPLLQDVAHRINPELFDDLNPNQQRTALTLIQMSLRQAVDLLENPARAPGWRIEDPAMLDAQGQASRLLVHNIETMAAQRPEFGATLNEPGVFLDVGTGVGWLAIEAARSWPALRVVGIDLWEPALKLAHENLAQSRLNERIEFRLQSVEQLDEHAVYTLAWLPGPFIAQDRVTTALQRINRALAPGWLAFIRALCATGERARPGSGQAVNCAWRRTSLDHATGRTPAKSNGLRIGGNFVTDARSFVCDRSARKRRIGLASR